jgi:hypothetical protein
VTLPDVELRAGDLNGDNKVNIQDMTPIASNFGNPASSQPVADFNKDGIISMPDLVAAAVNYGKEGPRPWDLMP